MVSPLRAPRANIARFLLIHLAALSVFVVPFEWTWVWWLAGSYLIRMFGVTAGYVHSPGDGFWWSHVGWILSTRYDDHDPKRVADFGRFPELRWLDRHHWAPTVAYGAAIWMVGGFGAFAWAYLLATVLLYHATFAINSIAHIWGTRAFPTRDDSRNNFWLALLTLGEGWHNNHHYCRSSCRQGVHWWQVVRP
jgi:stearoyl-CoA desaturase (delta-9 desaturase)